MTPTRRRIALLAAPETSASVLYGLYDVLLSVGAVYPDMTAGEPGDALLDVSIVARDEGAVPLLRQHPRRAPRSSIDEVDAVDAVIVCDMYTPIDTAPRGRYATEIAWLRRLHDQGHADRLGLHRVRAARRVGSARRPLVRRPLGVRRPVPLGLPAGQLRRERGPRSRVRAGAGHHGRRRHGLAGPGAPPDRPAVRHRARGPDRQGLPARRPRGRPAAVRGDDPTRAGPATRRSATALAWIDEHFTEPIPVAAMAEPVGPDRGGRSPGASRRRRAAGRSTTSTPSGSSGRGS